MVAFAPALPRTELPESAPLCGTQDVRMDASPSPSRASGGRRSHRHSPYRDERGGQQAASTDPPESPGLSGPLGALSTGRSPRRLPTSRLSFNDLFRPDPPPGSEHGAEGGGDGGGDGPAAAASPLAQDDEQVVSDDSSDDEEGNLAPSALAKQQLLVLIM